MSLTAPHRRYTGVTITGYDIITTAAVAIDTAPVTQICARISAKIKPILQDVGFSIFDQCFASISQGVFPSGIGRICSRSVIDSPAS